MTNKLNEKLFLDRIEIDNNDCWLWKGWSRGGGYGGVRYKGKNIAAHRLSYIFYKGEIPEGLCVCHSCDVRCCVNPNHLFLGTQQENVNDREAKQRRSPPKGSINGRAKLTEEQVTAIRSSIMSGKELAKLYKVSETTISFIKIGRTWNHV